MKYYKRLNLNHEEWLNAKDKTIGGSEAAIIVNKSKWGTIQDLYNKIALGKRKVIKQNERMTEGIETEDSIRILCEHDFKDLFTFKAPPKKKHWFFYRTDEPRLSVTPDSLCWYKDDKKKKGGAEFKNVELRKREDIELWESGRIPNQYLYQVLHYFIVLNDIEFVVFYAHIKHFRPMVIENGEEKWVFSHAIDQAHLIFREDVEDIIKNLEQQELKFLKENIDGHKRPSLTIKL